MLFWLLPLLLVAIVAALARRIPHVREVALAAGLVAIADAIVYAVLFLAAPRTPESGCVSTHTFVYEYRTTFFLVGVLAAIAAAGTDVASALRDRRPVRLPVVAALSAAAGIACLFLVLFIGICGD
jgi:hypothetical protein